MRKKKEEIIMNPDVDIVMNTSCAVDMEKTYNSIVDYYHDAIKNRNKNIKLTFTVGKLSIISDAGSTENKVASES